MGILEFVLGCHPIAFSTSLLGQCKHAAKTVAKIQNAVVNRRTGYLNSKIPIEPLILKVILVVENASGVCQVDLRADKDKQIAFPLLKKHIFVVFLSGQFSVHQRTSVTHRLFRGDVAADTFHASLGEEDDIVIEVDCLAHTTCGDAGMGRRIDFAVVGIQCRHMVKHCCLLIRRLTEDPQCIVASHHTTDRGFVSAFLIVVHVADVARIIQAAMPHHIRIIRITAEEHSVVKNLSQCASQNLICLITSGREFYGHIVLPISQRLFWCCHKCHSSLGCINSVL